MDRVLGKLEALERRAGTTPLDALRWRQVVLLDRISEMEAAYGIPARPLQPVAVPVTAGTAIMASAHVAVKPAALAEPSAAAAAVGTSLPAGAAAASAVAAASPPVPAVTAVDPSGSEVQQRLQAELLQRGLVHHRFVQAPPEYYDRPLEFRRQILNAASVDHLCKSIVMVNTKAPAHIGKASSDPALSKYVLVIVQYTARMHAEKLKVAVHKMCAGSMSRKQVNMRLAPEDVSDELTGFSHNAVSPIGIRTQLPVIISHRITQLQPDFFWLGAGEVDLKVGLSAAEFVRAYNAIVIDCTYDDDNGDAASSEEGS